MTRASEKYWLTSMSMPVPSAVGAETILIKSSLTLIGLYSQVTVTVTLPAVQFVTALMPLRSTVKMTGVSVLNSSGR